MISLMIYLLWAKHVALKNRLSKSKREYISFIGEMKKRAANSSNKSPTFTGNGGRNRYLPLDSINWLTEISTIAGGLNEFRDVELASVQTDWEDVLNREPDYILLAWVGVRNEKVKKEVVLKRPGWKELAAVKRWSVFNHGRRIVLPPFPAPS